MATIYGALQAGVIDEYRLPEHEGRGPLRPLYLATSLFDWVDSTDELYIEDWSHRSGGRTRYEHLVQLFCDFRCDRRPLVGDLNRVQPTRKGVWKMQCPGIRVFGWAPDSISFVAVCAAFSEETHGSQSKVDDCVELVLNFIQKNKLAETVNRGERSALFQSNS